MSDSLSFSGSKSVVWVMREPISMRSLSAWSLSFDATQKRTQSSIGAGTEFEKSDLAFSSRPTRETKLTDLHDSQW